MESCNVNCRTGLRFRVSMTQLYRGLIGQEISVKGLGVSDGSLHAGTLNFMHIEYLTFTFFFTSIVADNASFSFFTSVMPF